MKQTKAAKAAVRSVLKNLRRTFEVQAEGNFKAFVRSSGDAATINYGKEQAYRYAILRIDELLGEVSK